MRNVLLAAIALLGVAIVLLHFLHHTPTQGYPLLDSLNEGDSEAVTRSKLSSYRIVEVERKPEGINRKRYLLLDADDYFMLC
jgi:hypothetical protein